MMALNLILKQTKESSAGCGLRVNVPKENSDLIVTGLFTETGLVGILEAADFKCVDQVLPFLGVISDRFVLTKRRSQ